jgi:GDP/UDP-N,N'-diacetylbacillosamine 2-epimerase (hydrolysing)
MSRKICVVTGTRAEYGQLRRLLSLIKSDKDCALQLVVTGMHLSPEFGLTYRQIESEGFEIDRKVVMLISSDSPTGIAKSMGIGILGFADALEELKPDLIVLLGDRFEILAAASAALIARIPVAHIHGGESTEGLIDEAIRHSVTKMSHLHFVATEEYRRRVIQLGEQPDKVFLVGGLGVDCLKDMELMDLRELEASLGFRLKRRNFLITFHPVTLDSASVELQMQELLNALSEQQETGLIFTMPNADTEGRVLIDMIKSYVLQNPEFAIAHTSLGQQRYFSCMAHVDAVIGNSSSGLAEAPSFKTATINIGDRQRGRLQAKSVVNCLPEKADILNAIDKVLTPSFREALESVQNPYGTGGASEKIFNVIKRAPLKEIVKKRFYDIRPCE